RRGAAQGGGQPTGRMPQKIYAKRGEQPANGTGQPAEYLVGSVTSVEQALAATGVRRPDDRVREARDGEDAVEADQHPGGVPHGYLGGEPVVGVEPGQFSVE